MGTPVNIRVNNAFSPINATHQPYGWDQMAALYRFYKVVGCHIKVTFASQYAANTTYVLFRPVPVNENFTMQAVDVAQAAEKPHTRTFIAAAPGGPVLTFEHEVDIPKQLGVTREQFDADVSEYSAAVTAAPNRYAYCQLGAAGANNSVYGEALIEIVYTIHFWQRITQGQS